MASKGLFLNRACRTRFFCPARGCVSLLSSAEARVFDLAQDEMLPAGLSTSTKAIDVRKLSGTLHPIGRDWHLSAMMDHKFAAGLSSFSASFLFRPAWQYIF